MSEYIPPLNPLLSFVTAAQCGDVVQAAQRLNVTAAAVRKSVNTLETYLGVQLLQRRRGRLQLTEAGAFYLSGLEGAFERIDTATRALLFREQRETLTICAFPSFVMRWLIPRWSVFHEAYPHINVHYATTLHSVDFERDRVDAAILSEERDFHGYDRDFLFSAALFPVCSPALLKAGPPIEKPEDLARHTLLHSLTRPRDWERWLEQAGVSGIDPRKGMRLESLSIVYQAAFERLGVAIGVDVIMRQDLEQKRLVAPLGYRPKVQLDFFLTYPERMKHSGNLRLFRDWLIETTRADREAGPAWLRGRAEESGTAAVGASAFASRPPRRAERRTGPGAAPGHREKMSGHR